MGKEKETFCCESKMMFLDWDRLDRRVFIGSSKWVLHQDQQRLVCFSFLYPYFRFIIVGNWIIDLCLGVVSLGVVIGSGLSLEGI